MPRKLLVISDVHSNLEALEAVLGDADSQGPYDAQLCAGDVVGYGPNPNEVIEIISSRKMVTVLGNHDRAVLRSDWKRFNNPALIAAEHNQRVLAPHSKAFLERLSNVPYLDPRGEFLLVHGSPGGAPEQTKDKRRYEDEYIQGLEDYPGPVLRAFDVKLAIVGHTHQPTLAYSLFFRMPIKVYNSPSAGKYIQELDLKVILRALVNFGSVGQPRDEDPRAAYGIVEIHTDRIFLEYRRVPYDVKTTQSKIKEAGLPHSLSARLSRGI